MKVNITSKKMLQTEKQICRILELIIIEYYNNYLTRSNYSNKYNIFNAM